MLIVFAAIALAAFAGLRIWSWNRHDWWHLLLPGVYLVVIAGATVAYGLAVSQRRRQSARFVLTRDGFAVRPTVPPAVLVALLMSVLAMQVDMLVEAWHDVTDPGSGTLATDVAFASALTDIDRKSVV